MDDFTKKCLIDHAERYPELQIEDVFKYIFQSACGCEHMITNLENAVAYIKKEAERHGRDAGDDIDTLDGPYSRVHLSCLDRGLAPETLGKLFFASAKQEPNGKADIERKLAAAKALVREGKLPFSNTEFEEAVARWQADGYPAIHHSETFRACYCPAYRVISNTYVTYLPLFAKLDTALAKGPVTLAIEGGSASGKTTLASILKTIYNSTILHMDDFFLRPEQRTPARYAEPGGNIDRERFLEEVLIPHSKGEPIQYRPFDCSTFCLAPPIKIRPQRLTVIEGAYSMHPALSPYYDLSVFLDISSEQQKARIEARNSAPMAHRFFTEWIPLEQVYFRELDVKQRCDLIL